MPKTDDWLHEVKVDGYRCLAAVGAGQVRLYTRSGLDWTTEFGALTPAFEKLPCDTALVDGEVVALAEPLCFEAQTAARGRDTT